jgi:iron complex outermembrane receptor protein
VAHWQGSAHLAYTDARFDEFFESVGTSVVSRAGNAPANTPDWVAGAQLAWQAAPTLVFAADWRHVGKRYANNANTAWERGYDLLGLSARWQALPGVALRARVNNATDKTYSATVGTNLAVLGPARTVSVSADWRF